jgi:hypothetical protein
VKKTLVVVAMLAGIVLTGCSSEGENQQEIPTCTDPSKIVACDAVIQYEGRDLHCITWEGGNGDRGLTCDFVRFYNDNVEPFAKPTPAYEPK